MLSDQERNKIQQAYGFNLYSINIYKTKLSMKLASQ